MRRTLGALGLALVAAGCSGHSTATSNDTLVELSLKTHTRVWQYGHSGVAGSSPGYLNTPDDAYRLPSGITTVADIQNCRIVQLGRAGQVARILGGSCVHDPPRGFASP